MGTSPRTGSGVPSPAEQLAGALAPGRFALLAELECPRNASAANVERQAAALAPYADAVVCTDNSAAVARMSPVAAAALVARMGVLPLVQLTCRDRNRLALQSELLGAAAVGAAGVICLTGDPPETGNHPQARAVDDLTVVELLRAARELRAGHFLSGDATRPAPALLLGCAVNPGEGGYAVERLAAKVAAGAELAVTQMVFDVAAFARWMEEVRATGLHREARIFASVAVIGGLGALRFIGQVPGVTLPVATAEALRTATDPEAAGIGLAAALLRDLRDVPGVAGIQLLTFGRPERAARVIEGMSTDLTPRPRF